MTNTITDKRQAQALDGSCGGAREADGVRESGGGGRVRGGRKGRVGNGTPPPGEAKPTPPPAAVPSPPPPVGVVLSLQQRLARIVTAPDVAVGVGSKNVGVGEGECSKLARFVVAGGRGGGGVTARDCPAVLPGLGLRV